MTPFITLNMTKVLSDIVSSDSQGNLMGALGQISSIATIFGALVMGFISSINPDYNVALSGSLIIIGGIILRKLLINEIHNDL